MTEGIVFDSDLKETASPAQPRRFLTKRRFIVLAVIVGLFGWAWLRVVFNPQRLARMHVEQLGGTLAVRRRMLNLPVFNVPVEIERHYVSLYLNHPRITNEEVISILRALPDLRTVNLDVCRITDNTLEALPRRHLLELSLVKTPVTDAGMQAVAKCTALSNLALTGTDITDAGLYELEKLSRLRRTELSATKISDAGFLRFVRTQPDCDIVIYQTNISQSAIDEAQDITKATITFE